MTIEQQGYRDGVQAALVKSAVFPRLGMMAARLGRKAIGLGSPAGGSSALQGVGRLARFVTSTKPGESIGPMGALKFMTGPRYPGLDRPVGVSHLNRKFDHSRAWLGDVMRNTGRIAGGYGAFEAGRGGYNVLSQPVENKLPITGGTSNLGVNRGIRKSMGQLMVESDNEGHGELPQLSRDLAVPSLRHAMYERAQSTDSLDRQVDFFKKFTPFGLGSLAFRNMAGRELGTDVNAKSKIRDWGMKQYAQK